MSTPTFPAHYGLALTPTVHNKIPNSINPSSPQNRLPTPFVAAITGAGKGLGYHIALAYASAGASGISISSRTLSDLTALESEILKIAKEGGRQIEVLKSVCDTQSDESVAALVEDVRRKWGGRVDAVVANAGVISKYITRPGDEGGKSSNLPIGVVEDDDFARVLNINLLGTWRIAKAFVPLLRDTKDGAQTLICSTSLASHSTNSLLTPIAYNVSKLACNRLIEHIDTDHRENDGIHAYALHPGAVVTPQTVGHQGEAWGSILSDEEGLAGAFCVWLSREKRGWLSERYVSCNWDVEELVGMRGEIEKGDKMKFRMVV